MNNSYTFGVVRIPDPPWTMVHCMKEDINGFLNFLPKCQHRLGIAMEVTQVVAKYLDWDIRYVWTANWGSRKNGSWNGAVGDVINHKIDSVVPVVTPSFSRSQVVRFTGYIIMNQQFCFTYCYHLGKTVTFEFSKLFASPLTMILLVTVFLFLSFIGLLVVSDPTERSHSWKRRCARGSDMLFMQLCQISTKPSIANSWKERAITGSLGIFFLFLCEFVCSKWMASFICIETAPFKDATHLGTKLAAGDLKIIAEYPGKTFWKLLLKEFPKLGESVRKYPQNVFYGSQGYNPTDLVLRNKNFISYMKSVTSKWFITEHKKKHPELNDVNCITDHACIKEALADGFIVAMDQPMLYEQLSRATRELRQFGILQKIEFAYGMNEMSLDEREKKRGGRPKVATTSLDFDSITMQLLFYGLGISSMAFVLELMTYCWLTKHDHSYSL